MVIIILSASTMLILAISMGYVLGWANKVFHVPIDPKIESINNALPGANCGGCNYVGCKEYAEAIVHHNAAITLCTVGGAGCADDIGAIMGVEVGETLPYRAVVHCGAKYSDRLGRSEYLGEQTCGAANLIAGYQGCTYGCMGLGDCVAVCDYDALAIIDGLAVVDYKNCTGCGLCAKACPRNLITMVPFKAERMLVVACSNDDFGNDVKAVCRIGCTGCKACTKANELFTMSGNVPVLNYDRYDPKTANFDKALEKCPMESLIFVGIPSEKDKAALKNVEVPERVEADFKTTVDETEWRG